MLVAWQRDVPVGDVYVWLAPAGEPELRAHLPGVPLLTHLEVVPRRRNMGIGSELLDVVRQRLSAAGHRQVALGVGLDNDDAQPLYKRHGYVEWPHGMVKTTAVIYLPDGRRQFSRNCAGSWSSRSTGTTPRMMRGSVLADPGGDLKDG